MSVSEGYGTFSLMATLFPILFFCVFATIIILIIVNAVKGTKQWAKNNNQPILAVPAKLVSKRADVRNGHHLDSDSFHHHHSSTSYYLTFEFETGSRSEFNVSGDVYGLFIEGDSGKLQFQGTRYLGFERM